MRQLLLTSTILLLMSACVPVPPRPLDSAAKVQRLDEEPLALRGPGGEDVALSVEVARTPEQWERGLMGRRELKPGRGMLFVFDREQVLRFWMKDTLIPLDVLYFDARGRYVSAATMEPCVDDPCPQYPSDAPALYALEIPAGEAESRGIGAGWRLAEPPR